MIEPIRPFGFPLIARPWPLEPYLPVDSFAYGTPLYFDPFPTHYLSLYWRLTDAAMNAEFWTNLHRSLRDSYHRMLMTATRPEVRV